MRLTAAALAIWAGLLAGSTSHGQYVDVTAATSFLLPSHEAWGNLPASTGAAGESRSGWDARQVAYVDIVQEPVPPPRPEVAVPPGDACCASGCCGNGGCATPGFPTKWSHRTGVFGEFLYLRARDAEVAYSEPIDGIVVDPSSPLIQVGRVGVTDPDFASGFRFGFSKCLDKCTSIQASYTSYESSTDDTLTTDVPFVLRSLVVHPGTLNAAADYLDSTAALGVDFDLIDLDYRSIWSCGNYHMVNYLVGLRYARLNQEFVSIMSNGGPAVPSLETVSTESDFEGAGLRLGLDGERHACRCGLFVYGRGVVSLLGGEADADYFQGSGNDPVIVDTRWGAGRLVTVLELEVGVGWQSRCGRWRFKGGYQYHGWLNVVRTDEWIRAVQSSDFRDLGDRLTFDGLSARVEYRF